VAWGDYDNDGDLDILLAGNTGSGRVTQIYRNDSGCAVLDDGYETDEDQTLSVLSTEGVLNNDQIGPYAIALDTAPAHGALALALDGSFVYTPTADFNGTDSFVYKLTGWTETLTATVALTITSVNDAPVAVNDTYTLTEDSILTVTLPISGLLANDTDVELDALTAVLDTNPLHGTLSWPDWQIGAIDTAGDVGWYSSLAVIGGQPAISYRDFINGDLKYARYDGASWQIEVVDAAGNVGLYTSLAEIGGQPAISYYDATNGDLKYARYDGTSWQIEAVDTAGKVGYETSLAEIGGQPAISYYDATQWDLKYARYDGTAWQIETVDTAGDVGWYTSLIEIDGQPAISYYIATIAGGSYFDLKFARYDGASWQIEAVDTVGTVGWYTSLALIGGQPAISYYDATREDLKYARYDGASWQIEAVDTTGNVGKYTSLAEIDGQPAISYYAVSSEDLKFARYDGTSWQIETIDTTGSVGTYTSLAVIGGQPAISYYDATKDDLKYAIWNEYGTYSPAPNFCGTDSFTYHADDGLLASNVATVTLNVSCVNDAPIATDNSYTLDEGTMQSGNVISDDTGNGADSDIENVTLTVSVDADVTHGTLSLAADGSFVYIPSFNFNGSDSFTYILSDGVLTDTATVNLTVTDLPNACFVSLNDSGVTDYASPNARAVQTAIHAANPGDTVKIAGTCVGVTQTEGISQTAYITQNITLSGGYTTTNWGATPDLAANPTTLSANNLGRVVVITGTAQAMIENLIVTNGTANAGGGLYVDTNAGLTLLNSQVMSNTNNGDGGGVGNLGQTVISDTTFSYNQADVAGAVGNGPTGRLTITESSFSDNQAGTAGAIGNTGWVTVTASSFISNTSGSGGAMANASFSGSPGWMWLADSTFISNTVPGSGSRRRTTRVH
jgi:hypothetical protein